MNLEILFAKYNRAIAWNSFLYAVNRICKTIVTFILFAKLATSDFAAWANILSLVFLATLWCDFGLRRSLPRYCPEFAKNAALKKRFITTLLIWYTIFLLVVNSVALYAAPFCAHLLRLSTHINFFYLGCLLFFVESIKSVLRILFTSHFWEKQYNLLEAFFVSIRTISIFFLAALLSESQSILWAIFSAEIAACSLIVIGTLLMLPFLHKDPDYQLNQPINGPLLTKEFASHSAIMWGLIAINSLTERNALIPFFTYSMSHATSNIFKVANDAALFFQRFIIPVIGAPSRALLSHVEALLISNKPNTTPLLTSAFEKVNKRIILFTVPPIVFALLLYVSIQTESQVTHFFLNKYTTPSMVSAFLVLTTFYLIHLLFLAYEQVLEVKRNYREFLMSFIPYIGIILLFVVCAVYPNALHDYSLISIIVLIHSIRLISIGLRVLFVRGMYHLPLFIGYFLKVFCISLAVGGTAFLSIHIATRILS